MAFNRVGNNFEEFRVLDVVESLLLELLIFPMELESFEEILFGKSTEHEFGTKWSPSFSCYFLEDELLEDSLRVLVAGNQLVRDA